MKGVEIGPDGRFEFPFVREGDWILRLVSRGREIVLQRQLRTQPFVVTDTGLLRAPRTVPVDVDMELPDVEVDPNNPDLRFSFGVWIRQPTRSGERGTFVQKVDVTTHKLQVEGLEPGTYELELFSSPVPERITFSLSLWEKSTSLFRTLVVRPDGTTEPAKLSFR